MNVLHVTEDHSLRNTGVTRMVDLLSSRVAQELGDHGSVAVLAAGSDGISPPPRVRLVRVPLPIRGFGWRWAPSLQRVLIETIGQADVVQLHGVWMSPQLLAARLCKRTHVPTVLSSHGMLEPWMWTEQGHLKRAKKFLYWKILAFRAFRHVAVMQATTLLERDHLAQLFPKSRLEVIPNAVDTSRIDLECASFDGEAEKYILFVGRLHPKKGVDLLLRAFGKARLPRIWTLVIAGPVVDLGYYRQLVRIVGETGLQDRVRFQGPVDAAEKWRLLKLAWFVMVPSRSEAIGLVNLEAAACYTPTITTRETGLWDWEEGGGLLSGLGVDELARAITQACSWGDHERKQRGVASRKLIILRYDAAAVTKRWMTLYEELAGGHRPGGRVGKIAANRQGRASGS